MADRSVLPPRAASLLERLPELKLTVDGVLALDFISDPPGPRAASTRRRDRAIRTLVHRACGDAPVERVDEAFLDEVRRGLFALGYSRDTVGRVRTLVRKATRAWAIGVGVPVRVDGRTAMGRPGGGPAPDRREPTLDEVELLLAHLRARWMRAVVELVVGCGVRLGDLRDLKIAEAKSPHLLLLVGGRWEVVVVPQWARRHLLDYVEWLETKGCPPTTALFGGRPNEAKNARRLATALRRAQRDAGLEGLAPIGLRVLRRIFIATAAAARLPRITAPGRRQDLSDRNAVMARYERRKAWAGTWRVLTEPPLAPRRRRVGLGLPVPVADGGSVGMRPSFARGSKKT